MKAHDLLSPREIALKTGWPIARIRNLINRKKIRHVRIGGSLFLPITAVDEYLAANMVEPIGTSSEALGKISKVR